MRSWTIGITFAAVLAALAAAQDAPSPAARFDGKWLTTLTCPAKGNTSGYTWHFASVIRGGALRGEHGTSGEAGYLLLEGKIAADGSAKLNVKGIVGSRKYAREVFNHEGEEYTYGVKAQFQEKEGSGVRNEGLGIVGRACTFDFVKQPDRAPDAGQ
jgi:hypothetical protein